jgi:hypothetical protein
VQPVAGHHAGEQDDDLGDDQQRRGDLDQRAEGLFDRCEERMAAITTSPAMISLSSA